VALRGERVAELRKELGMNQKQLAEILGVAHNTLSQWESNSKDPSTAMLKRLCEILGCTSDYLIGLVDI